MYNLCMIYDSNKNLQKIFLDKIYTLCSMNYETYYSFL